MIDKQTQAKLQKIVNNVMSKYGQLIKKEKVNMSEVAREILSSRSVSDEVKDKIKRVQEKGGFDDFEVKNIDRKKEREMIKEVEYRIRKEIQEGRLKPAERDEFIRKIEKEDE